jgi:hypothetical protein
MADPFATVFNAVKDFAKKIFADEKKVQTAVAAGLKDAPNTAAAAQKLWVASLPVVAALTVAIKDDGINIGADEEAYKDIVAWLPAVKAFSAVVESDYKDIVAKQVTAANTQPVIATAEAALQKGLPTQPA